MSTSQVQRPPERTPRESGRWLGRAWTALALVPVFFFIGFAIGEGMYALLGYKPENANALVWFCLPVLAQPARASEMLACGGARSLPPSTRDR